MGVLLFFLLLQEPVRPVRVSISVEGPGFAGLVRAEINKNRGVIVASRKPDYDVYVTATPLTEDEKRFGCAAAVLVVADKKYHLSIHTSRDLDSLARAVTAYLEREFFKQKAGR